MGTYDVNLKKNKLGYQFDRNVYIGQQVNDNRVVTVKELNNFSGAASVAGSVVDINLTTSSLTEAPANLEYDQINFEKNGSTTHSVIVPGYLVPGSTIPTGAKISLIAQAGENKAYQVYVSDKSLDDIPTVYLKNASVSGASLTLTKADNSTITFSDSYPTTFTWNTSGGGVTGQLNGTNLIPISFPSIPAATASHDGVVTTGTQSFAGSKTFTSPMAIVYNSDDPLSITFDNSKAYFLHIHDNSNGNDARINFKNDLTDDRTYHLPDNDGTFLLDSTVKPLNIFGRTYNAAGAVTIDAGSGLSISTNSGTQITTVSVATTSSITYGTASDAIPNADAVRGYMYVNGSALTAVPSSGYDNLHIVKEQLTADYPIVPQYQKFATAPSDATVYVCAAMPDNNNISSLYKTNLVPGQTAQQLYLFGKTYDGTAAVSFNYGSGLKLTTLSRTSILSVDAVDSITAGTAGSSIVNASAVRSAVNGMFSYDSGSGILTIISIP